MTPQADATEPGDISVETISLDREAATYNSYLQSQRMMRAATANVLQSIVAVAITIATLFYIDPSIDTIAVSLIMLLISFCGLTSNFGACGRTRTYPFYQPV